MKSNAATPAEYLAALPPDRRAALETLRDLVRKHAPDAREVMQYGMIVYELGGTMLVAMASQKNHLSIYGCGAEAIATQSARLGKLDCGKGCIRFRRLEDLPLDVIADLLDAAVARRQAAGGPA